MNIGIVCYASVGGSGIIATELAISLAERETRWGAFQRDPEWIEASPVTIWSVNRW